MIKSFRNTKTEALFLGTKCDKKWQGFERVARRKLLMLDAAVVLSDLKAPPNNHLEALRADRAGQHSIRINDQYCICFVWSQGGADRVEVVDYH